MNSYHLLESTLNEILEAIKPLREDLATRWTLIRDVQEVVQSVECLRGATVEPFGSFVSNLFMRGADLDISIELPNGLYVSSAAKRRKQSLLAELLTVLRQKAGYRKLQFVPNAKVPIVKFVSGHHGISCDISIDNLQGQVKSKFLFWINEIDGRFRNLVLLVKEWAKAHDINDPKTGTLNSYSISLMVLFHFQTCAPAILPPLKDIYPRNVCDDLRGVRTEAEKYVQRVSASNIAKFKSDRDRSREINRSNLSELFISFILKFRDLSRKASDLAICPFTGRWEPIGSTMRWLPKNSALFIEDPFQQPENTARAVSSRQLTKICEAFEATRSMLNSEYLTRSSLLATLVRPQTCRLVPNASGSNPSYYGIHNTPASLQGHRAVHSPSQSQMQHQHGSPGQSSSQTLHQFQKKRYSPSPRQHQFQNMRQSSLPLHHQIIHLRLDDTPNHSVIDRPIQQRRR